MASGRKIVDTTCPLQNTAPSARDAPTLWPSKPDADAALQRANGDELVKVHPNGDGRPALLCSGGRSELDVFEHMF